MLARTRLLGLTGLLTTALFVLGSAESASAQDRSRERIARSSGDSGPELRSRDGSAPRLYVQPGEDTRIAPVIVPQWLLGIRAIHGRTGVTITDVLPFTPAHRAGLEPRDRIITVNGFQVGRVMGELYDLGTELQRQADHHGRVHLLVWNHRNGELVNMDIQMRPRGGFHPYGEGIFPRQAPGRNADPDEAF